MKKLISILFAFLLPICAFAQLYGANLVNVMYDLQSNAVFPNALNGRIAAVEQSAARNSENLSDLPNHYLPAEYDDGSSGGSVRPLEYAVSTRTTFSELGLGSAYLSTWADLVGILYPEFAARSWNFTSTERPKWNDVGLATTEDIGSGISGLNLGTNHIVGDVWFVASGGISIGQANGDPNTIIFSSSAPESGGVESINTKTGEVEIRAGDNIVISEAEPNAIVISGQAGGVTGVNGLTGNVVLEAGHNVSISTSGNTLTISSSGASSFLPEYRVISDTNATVLASDYLIWMDSEAAGDEQTIHLPDMAADSQSIVIRHLGSDHPTTIVRETASGSNTYVLSGDGASIAVDWLGTKNTWYWRQAY